MRFRTILPVCLCLCAALLMLTGCTVDYDRSDIDSYVRDTYGITQFRLAKESRELVGEDGYTDYLWTVELWEPSGVTFTVTDDYHWGAESVTNYLHSDYEARMLVHYAEEYGALEQLQVKSGTEDGLTYAYLSGSYATRGELESLFRELTAFRDYVAAAGYAVENSFFAEFLMDFPLRDRMENPDGELSYTVTDGDFSTRVTGVEEADLQAALDRMLQTCVAYGYTAPLADFTEGEISSAVYRSGDRIWVHEPGMEQGMYRALDTALASRYSYGISFGALYSVLTETGFAVEGSRWHYTFVGADGAVYEVSYDLYAPNEAEPQAANHYYYIKDGQQVWMPHYFYNHFSEKAVEEMLGLDILIGNEPAE